MNPRSAATRQDAREHDNRWTVLGYLLLAAYAWATFAPRGPVWGFHSLGYFPPVARAVVLLACAVALLPPVSRRLERLVERTVGGGIGGGRMVPGAIAILALAVFYTFPIATDIYGDSRNLAKWNADNAHWQWEWVTRIFRLSWMQSKEALTTGVHRTLAHVLSVPIVEAYRIGSACSGAVAILLWLLFVRRHFDRNPWSGVLAIAGLFAGANAFYFGHVENYAFAAAVMIGFLTVSFGYFDGRAPLWAVLGLFLLAAKAHLVGGLYLPAVLYLVAYHYRARLATGARLLRWKAVAWWVILPSALVGALLYFFYFKSYNEPHTGAGRQFQHTFLPLAPSPPPLDRYTLLSPNHVVDFVNVLWLVGAPALVVIMGLLVVDRRNIEWAHPRVMFFGIGLAYTLAFFFMLNPELSMPRDWDLYGLVSAPLLVFLAALVHHRRTPGPAPPTVLAAVCSCFTIAFMAVNAQPARLSHHLEHIGEHAYRTYYAGASYIIVVAIGLEPDDEAQLDRLVAVTNALGPVVVPPDRQFTFMTSRIVNMHVARGHAAEAQFWAEESIRYNSTTVNAYVFLADLHFLSGNPQKALEYEEKCLAANGEILEVLKQAIVTAQALGRNELAWEYLDRARRLAPDDPELESVAARLPPRS